MSMYNLLHGTNSQKDVLLKAIGVKEGDTGRFRDCFICDGKIVIYTRNGGGNREFYQGCIDNLATNPNYLYDEDDSFDCTYCSIYFKYPEEHKVMLKLLETDIDISGDERWALFFKELDKIAVKSK